jgi:indole-3-glycerol phosphate synthase
VTILDEILEYKRGEVARARAAVPDETLRARAVATVERPRGFRRALVEAEGPAVIAEVKKRSPSKGLIRADFEPVSCAEAYASAGAAALSVLTDEHFFDGRLDYLSRIRRAITLPLLRKDFVIDAYQIDEARLAGADAVLLIVAALEPEPLAALHAHARTLGLDVLVEVHDEDELEIALGVGADLIGVNNRDLRTFEVDLAVTERLARCIPEGEAVLLVAESGIADHEDVQRLQKAGATAFLVGESLMREPDIGAALRRLRRSQ